MAIEKLKEIFEKYEIKAKKELSEEVTFEELEIDSLDLATISFELEDIYGKEINVDSSQTVGELLAVVGK